ncbi:MAG: hypothetical protein NVSMB44_39010 [Ktedonobacteraceae bacterium]
MAEFDKQFGLIAEVLDSLCPLLRTQLGVAHLLNGHHAFLKAFIARPVNRAKPTFAYQLRNAVAPPEQVASHKRARDTPIGSYAW